MTRAHWIFLVAGGALLIGLRHRVAAVIGGLAQKSGPRRTIEERLAQYGPVARARWQPYFARAQIAYPARGVILVGIKDEQRFEVYATASAAGSPRFIRSYPILAASGKAGPKLKEGDRQVPEGLYQIESLNPNSRFHLSLRVNYPNAFDRQQAERDGRTGLGGDIMIHGNAVSIGCLAMGDEAAEDLFVLAADTGLANLQVILTPVDFRSGKTLPATVTLPPWTDSLYASIRAELARLPARP